MNIITQNFLETTLRTILHALATQPPLARVYGLALVAEKGLLAKLCWQKFIGKSLLAKTNWQKVQISLIFLESVI
ncbi:MAG: hypothetical protein IJM03_14335 [Treponema sp.]|nr:hypothetical protein [Treponema sp.]